MKSSNDHIDKLFRNNLENQSFDIPTEFIDDLTNRLDNLAPNKKRRKGVWFFLFNSLFLVIFTILSFVKSSPDLNTEQHDLSTSNRETLLSSTRVSELKEVKAKSELTSTPELVLGENPKSTDEEDKLNTTATIAGPPFEKSQDNPTKTKQQSSFTGDQKTPNVKKGPSENKFSGTTFFSKNDGNQGVSPPDTIIIRDTIIVLDTLIIRDTIIVNDTITLTDSNNPNEDVDKWKMEIQLFSGYNYGANSFSTSSSSGPLYLLEESAIFSPSFGFDLNASWKSISVGSGISYFQTGEKFVLNSSSVSQYDSAEIVGYDYDTVVFNQQTQTWDTVYVPVYDSVTYYDTTTAVDNWVNTYSWLSIPINVGYRFDFGKWAVIPRAGVTFNIGMRNSQRDYPNSVGGDITISSSTPAKFNLDYLLQVELRRSFQKAEIYVSPGFRGNVTPMNSVRKYQSFGLRFGVVIPL